VSRGGHAQTIAPSAIRILAINFRNRRRIRLTHARGDGLDITVIAYTMKNVQFFSLESILRFQRWVRPQGTGILSARCDGFRYSYDTLGNVLACEIIRVTIAADINCFYHLSPNSWYIDCRMLLCVVILKALLTVLALRVYECFTYCYITLSFHYMCVPIYFSYQLMTVKRERLKRSFVHSNISKRLNLYKNLNVYSLIYLLFATFFVDIEAFSFFQYFLS